MSKKTESYKINTEKRFKLFYRKKLEAFIETFKKLKFSKIQILSEFCLGKTA
jgi:hypothetical protein